jgi:pimeloyl-ACP methyl ester carboxylesterase
VPKASINGINIDYKVEGNGDPLVLIMGFTGTRLAWIFQRPAFRKYFKVITFDNRGAGRSDRPDGPYSMKMMMDDTVGLMDHLGIEKAHILGISMGGMIAQEIAINYPERVMKLVLGCTFAYRNGDSGHSSEYMKYLGLHDESPDDELRNVDMRRLLGTVFSLGFNSGPFRMFIYPLSKVYARLHEIGGVRAQFEAILGHHTLDRLHMIKAPTLVISGTEDRLMKSESSEVLASRIPNARLVKIEGGSHAVFIGKRGRFNREVLDFLREG